MTKISRLEFLQQISNQNIVEIMCNYFDQSMALYNILNENLNNLIISQSIQDQSILFTIRFKELNTKIEDYILIKDRDIVFCYGRQFCTYINKLPNEIQLTFIEVAA